MKISKEVKIGLLVAATFLVFFIGFYFLKGSSVFNSNMHYYAYFDDVQGLQPSAQVQIKGLGVGKVVAIELGENLTDKVKVTIEIPDDNKIPVGSIVELTSFDLLGTMGIAMKLSGSTTIAEDETTLSSSVESGIVDKVSSEVTPLLKDLRNVIFLVDSVLLSVNEILNENTRVQLQGSIASFNKTMANFSSLSATLDAQSEKIAHIISNADNISTNLANNSQNIDQILSNAKATTDQLAKAPITETVNKLNSTADQLNTVMTKINNGDGTIGQMVNDKELYKEVNTTLKTLSDLAADLKAHPGKYINITIFGRKAKVGE